MRASSLGHAETTALLLEAGADIDTQEQNGITALMLASLGGHTEIVRMLLEHGADIDVTDNEGMTREV